MDTIASKNINAGNCVSLPPSHRILCVFMPLLCAVSRMVELTLMKSFTNWRQQMTSYMLRSDKDMRNNR